MSNSWRVIGWLRVGPSLGCVQSRFLAGTVCAQRAEDRLVAARSYREGLRAVVLQVSVLQVERVERRVKLACTALFGLIWYGRMRGAVYKAKQMDAAGNALV